MKGCRPLTRAEVKALLAKSNLRDSALLTLGFCTGYRISELLSLTLGDVCNAKGNIYDFITVKASNTKTKEGRTVRLNSDAKKALSHFVSERLKDGAQLTAPLFISRKTDGGKLRAISRVQAWRVIQGLCELADVINKAVGTHSLRKTFAARVYEAVKGELGKVQIALGHKNIGSTISYLSFNQEDVDQAIMSISL
jgi:site-specific recombinase XerD